MSEPLLFVDTSESNVTVTGNLHVTNHLGVGTTSPATKLHLLGVGNGSSPRLRFETLNNGVNGNYTPGGTDIGGIQFAADDLTWSTQHVSSEIVGIHNSPNYSGALGTLSFRTSTSQGSNPNEKMSISSQGYLKYNNQPRFSAYSNSSNGTFSGFNSPVKLTSTFYNVGSHYSTSTGGFTAPVTGHYRFSVAPWNNSASEQQYSMWYRTSNSGSWDDIQPYKLLGGSPTGDEIIWTNREYRGLGHPTFDLYVPANYQIAFGGRGGASVTIYRAHSFFSGELISAA